MGVKRRTSTVFNIIIALLIVGVFVFTGEYSHHKSASSLMAKMPGSSINYTCVDAIAADVTWPRDVSSG